MIKFVMPAAQIPDAHGAAFALLGGTLLLGFCLLTCLNFMPSRIAFADDRNGLTVTAVGDIRISERFMKDHLNAVRKIKLNGDVVFANFEGVFSEPADPDPWKFCMPFRSVEFLTELGFNTLSLSAPRLASPQVLTRRNALHSGHPDPTYGNPSVAAPTNHGVFRQATPTKVEPHEPRTVVRTAVSGDDDAHRKVQHDEIKHEPEHKSKSKPARKERHFQ